MYSLLALDLDDTLLGRDGAVSPVNLEAVAAARAVGVEVTLVTARSWRATAPFVGQLSLGLPVICVAGAGIYAVDGTPQRLFPLALADAHRLASLADEAGWAARLYFADGRIFALEVADERVQGGASSLLSGSVPRLSPLLEAGEAPLQLVLSGPRSIEGALSVLNRFPDVAATVYGSGTSGADCHLTHAGVSKGSALHWLCERRSIPRESVVAMGDSEADLSMIKWAGVGVAMGWAPPRVREGADLVMSADDPHPVATAIRQLLKQ